MIFDRRTILASFSSTALLATGACGRKANGPVHIATAAGNFNQTMNAVLKQQKFLESFGLNPELTAISDGSKILAGVFSGSIDMAPLSGFSQVFPAIEKGADLKITNAATLVPMLALFSGKPNVKSLKDLEGKVVGSGALGSLIHQLTVTLLKKYNVDVSKVRFINLGSNTDVFKGVMIGNVDAGVGPSSFVPDAAVYKVHAIPNGDMSVELPLFTYQAGWTSGRAIKEKRDTIVRVLAAYAKLFRFVEDPASKDLFLAARRAAFPQAPEAEHLGEWNFLQRAKPLALDLTISEERVRYLQQINLDFGAQKTMLPYDRIVDTSLARDALKLIDST
jgi:ABC-type nitrate/sulfonate/bicarbonate transport system substrate-binding protein